MAHPEDPTPLLELVNLARRRRIRLGGFRCAGCREWLPATDFTRDVRNPSGLSSRCRPCLKELRAGRR